MYISQPQSSSSSSHPSPTSLVSIHQVLLFDIFSPPSISVLHLVESPDSKPKRYYSYHLRCIAEKLRHKKFKQFQFSCSVVSDSATPWTAARQASLSITNSQSLLKLSLAVVKLLVRRGDECKLNPPDCKAWVGSHAMKVLYKSEAVTRNTIRCCISRWRRCFSVSAFFFLFFKTFTDVIQLLV